MMWFQNLTFTLPLISCFPWIRVNTNSSTKTLIGPNRNGFRLFQQMELRQAFLRAACSFLCPHHLMSRLWFMIIQPSLATQPCH